MLDLVFAVALCWQDPAPAPQPAPAPAPAAPAAPTFEDWDDQRLRTELATFKERMKGRKIPLAKRTEAVEALARGRHEKLVKPLAEVVLKDEALTVRQLAADALAHQPEARKTLLALLRDDALEGAPTVQASLVRALSKGGYESDDWKIVGPLFGRDYRAERIDLQKAILELATTHAEKQACDVLLANLDPPQPVDIDDPSNPPAEYWEQRWKAWEVWREDVKQGLFAITGQRFSTSAEAKTWLDKNGRKIGIR